MALPQIIAVIDIATVAASLFGSKGNPVKDLLEMQAALLRNILTQLSELQNGVSKIAVGIDELKKLVGEIPHQTVDLLYRTQLETKISQYKEILEGYTDELILHGKDVAITEYKDQIIHELLGPIQELRTKIFSDKDPLDIPLINFCLQVEIAAMLIVVHNIPKTRIQNALEEYQNWFNGFLDVNDPQSLINRYQFSRIVQQNLVHQAGLLYYLSICLIEKHLAYMPGDGPWVGGEPPSIKVWAGEIDVKKYEFIRQQLITAAELAQLQPVINAGFLALQDLPSMLKINGPIASKTFRIMDWKGQRNPLANDPIFQSNKSVYQLLAEPMCANFVDTTTETPESGPISLKLTENGYTLLALASLVFVVQESLQMIQKFMNDPLLQP